MLALLFPESAKAPQHRTPGNRLRWFDLNSHALRLLFDDEADERRIAQSQGSASILAYFHLVANLAEEVLLVGADAHGVAVLLAFFQLGCVDHYGGRLLPLLRMLSRGICCLCYEFLTGIACNGLGGVSTSVHKPARGERTRGRG